MAVTTVWKGVIHFGGTEVGVKLHTAVEDGRIALHQLHRTDHARLRQQMICKVEQRPVFADEQARGFEMETGKYLIVDPEELEQAVPEASRQIEVHEFVPASQVDPVFLDRVYFLEPDRSDAAYADLARSLAELGVAGICTWTMRKRSYFGALQAAGTMLRLSTLRYADEVVSAGSLALADVAVTPKELEIAGELIAKLTVPFEPGKYRDEHRDKVMELVRRKARGEQIAVLPQQRPAPTEPDRLLEALQESLKRAA